ncbi:DUF397 domain-containing protein [Streptomyces halstedii]|uniref:DUF397 domain-containing protein n=1 Tax=Streptomyces halstedii TaxID=1944 RepID=A0ABS6TJ65_STRHA|nr:DUF397 domain-containing protein [Streptomyces halstedii]MBV7668313.1 DUF397 domain-containing protein [Streptomyces halstedii]
MHKHGQPHWRRSSYSDSSNGSECVEVATAPGAVQVRDSKNLSGPRLGFAPAAWEAFLTHASEH